jgi:hypothetical protein
MKIPRLVIARLRWRHLPASIHVTHGEQEARRDGIGFRRLLELRHKRRVVRRNLLGKELTRTYRAQQRDAGDANTAHPQEVAAAHHARLTRRIFQTYSPLKE